MANEKWTEEYQVEHGKPIYLELTLTDGTIAELLKGREIILRIYEHEQTVIMNVKRGQVDQFARLRGKVEKK